MTAWESIEFEFARLYSVLVGAPDGPAIMDYGDGRIFRDRLARLVKAGELHFMRRPNQPDEGEFSSLCAHASMAADRRNDVAHGIVSQIDKLEFFRNGIQVRFLNRDHWALIPPLYLVRRHIDGLPTFAYRSRDMDILSNRMLLVCAAISEYRSRLTARP